jgi:hypothetical protein
MFLRIVDIYLQVHIALEPEDQPLQAHNSHTTHMSVYRSQFPA